MSKTSKKLSKQKNLAKKRAFKVANKSKYESWRLAGTNTKSKRFRSKKKLVKTVDHPDGNCGNIACQKCDPCNIHRTSFQSLNLKIKDGVTVKELV
jgi:7-cyano-7-deazaguanine synthase in queuosine biosynthesis